MDVQCERCKTEYEFEDALVSRKGTTVKCTNCGFQFKIRPSVAGTTSEQWIVRTSDGTELVFTSLRDLQRAITQRQVGRNDALRRGNGPPRALGSIAELEPFFRSGEQGVPLATGSSPGSRDGIGTNTGFPVTQATGGAGSHADQRQASSRGSHPDDLPPRERHITLRPPSSAGAPPPRVPPSQLATVATVLAPAPEYPNDFSDPRRTPAMPPVAPAYPPAPHGPGRTLRTAVPPGRGAPQSASYVAAPPPPRPRLSERSYDDLDGSEPIAQNPLYSVAPGRRRMGGWIVAVVLTAGVGVIGYRIGQPYLEPSTKGVQTAAALDPKAARFLTDGEHAIEEGNLDAAKENFDKASALQEKDPRVLLDLAKLGAIRADVAWLRLRLFPADAPEDDVKAAKQQLADLVTPLRKAADDAAAAAPDDPAAARVKVDALRLAGEGTAARALVAKMGTTAQTATQPEALYVLAALDLAEIAPLWNTVLERLRTAAGAEGNLGRARAALVYALAKSGDVASATTELGRLSPRNPLLPALRAFLQKTPATSAEGGAPLAPLTSASAAPAAAVDVNSLPQSGGGSSSDPRVVLQQAGQAEDRGQLPRAAKLYEDALRYNARSSEALSGLGSVSLKQGDSQTAKTYFARAIAQNPSYVPALVGQADALWAQGDKPAAAAKYKDLIDRFPESSGYPAYCKTRAASGGQAASAGGNAPPASDLGLTVKPPPASASKVTPQPGKPGELLFPPNVPSDLPGVTPP